MTEFRENFWYVNDGKPHSVDECRAVVRDWAAKKGVQITLFYWTTREGNDDMIESFGVRYAVETAAAEAAE